MRTVSEPVAAKGGPEFSKSRPSSSAAVPPQRLAPQARWALASLALGMLLSSLGTSIANVGLPTLVQALHASFQDVQWVVLAYLLAITTLIVSVGRLGDLLGRRRLMLAGVLLFTVASVMCAGAATLGQLIAARAVQGLGAAVMMALTMAFVGETVPKDKAGSAMGLLGTMSAVGTALGPTLGGALIAGWGWQAMFLINVPLGMLALWMLRRYLPVHRPVLPSERPRFDVSGTCVLALVLGAYALAMTTGRGDFGWRNGALLVLAVLGVLLFVRVEAKAASPLVRPALFRDPVLRAGFVMSAMVTTVVMATLVVGPFYLSGALGLDAARVGLVMSAGPVAAALVGVPAGRAVDRFGANRVTLAGLMAMAAGTVALAMLPALLGLSAYVVPLLVATGGYAAFQAANNTGVLAKVQADQRGLVSGLLNLSRNLGLVTGASVMGAVFVSGSATPDASIMSALALTTGMQRTFAVAATLVFGAIAIALSTWTQEQRANRA
jgi:EmrB/QacA subfamily drug resistance transporter